MNNFLLFAIWVTLLAILVQLSGGSLDSSLANDVVQLFDQIISSKHFQVVVAFTLLITLGVHIAREARDYIENKHSKEKERVSI